MGDIAAERDGLLPIGQAKVERPGKDVTITAFSIMVGKALKAAEELAALGIDAEVINLRTIRPLDTATIISSVQKTNRCVSCEEGWATSGVGAEIGGDWYDVLPVGDRVYIAMEQAFDHLDAPVLRVAAKDVPLPYAANLEQLALPQVADIVAAVKAVCYR